MEDNESNIESLDRPMTMREFKNAIKSVGDELGLETTVQFDSIGLDDQDQYYVSSYGISNFSISDSTIESEMETLRDALEQRGVETFDAGDGAASYKWFGVTFPNIPTDGFSEFVETIEDVVSDRPNRYYNIGDKENLEWVRVTSSYDAYNENRGLVIEDVEDVVRDLKDAGIEVANWDVNNSTIYIVLKYNRENDS